MEGAFVDIPRGDLNHDGVLGYGSNPVLSYSKIQWSRYMQYESWPSISKSNAADFSRDQADGIDVSSAHSNVVGGWEAQVGEAHFQMECSGKGVCDRALGVCNCYDGYTGGACQRSECARAALHAAAAAAPPHAPAPPRAAADPRPPVPSPSAQRRARTRARATACAARCRRSRSTPTTSTSRARRRA